MNDDYPIDHIEDDILDDIPVDNIGVHASHCCKLHGCKYGDDDCPVVTGKVTQYYLCEMCNDFKIESFEQLEKVISGEVRTCEHCGCPIIDPEEKKSYFVCSSGGEPKKIMFNKNDAMETLEYEYIDEFNQDGYIVKSYMRSGTKYTIDF